MPRYPGSPGAESADTLISMTQHRRSPWINRLGNKGDVADSGRETKGAWIGLVLSMSWGFGLRIFCRDL